VSGFSLHAHIQAETWPAYCQHFTRPIFAALRLPVAVTEQNVAETKGGWGVHHVLTSQHMMLNHSLQSQLQ
jgi:hypothetical protein